MMDDVHDPLANADTRCQGVPLAVWSVVAAVVGVTAYLAVPGPRSSASLRRRQALIAYLRDHLSGADMALRVVHQAGSTHTGTDAALFRRLAKEFQEDHAVVRTLLNRLGASRRSIKRAAGYASGAVLSVTAGGEPGDLSLLRTLEGLAIGVQGKRCLWRALQKLSAPPPTVEGMNFTELEAKALRQWEAIEERRRGLVTRTFSAADPRVE